MESFIRKVVKSSDLSVLTKKIVRLKYLEEMGVSSMEAEQKEIFNSILYKVLDEFHSLNESQNATETSKQNSPGSKENKEVPNIDVKQSPRRTAKASDKLSVLHNQTILAPSNSGMESNLNKKLEECKKQKQIQLSDNENRKSNIEKQSKGNNCVVTEETMFSAQSGSDSSIERTKRNLSVEDVLKAVLDTDSNQIPDVEISEGETNCSSAELSPLIDVQNDLKKRKSDNSLQSSKFHKFSQLTKKDMSESNSEEGSELVCLSRKKRKKKLRMHFEGESDTGSGYSMMRKKKGVHIDSSSDSEACYSDNDKTLTSQRALSGSLDSGDSDFMPASKKKKIEPKHAKNSLALKKKRKNVMTSSSDSGMDSPTKLPENLSMAKNKKVSQEVLSSDSEDEIVLSRYSKKMKTKNIATSDSDTNLHVNINKKRFNKRKRSFESSSEDESVVSLKVHSKTKRKQRTASKQPSKKPRHMTPVEMSDSGEERVSDDADSSACERETSDLTSEEVSSDDETVGPRTMKSTFCRALSRSPTILVKKLPHTYNQELTPVKPTKSNHKHNKIQQKLDTDESSSDAEHSPIPQKSKKSLMEAVGDTSSLASDSDNISLRISPKKKSLKKKSPKRKDTSKSSKYDSSPTETDGDQQTKGKPQKSTEQPYIIQLKKICRAIGIFVRADRELKGCSSDNSKIRRLKELLKNAGMEGKPSMKKVEEIKLLKEAAELDTSKIISTSQARSRRNANSFFSCGYSVKPISPTVPFTPPRKKLSRLADIIDSEGSDSDT